MSVANDGTVKGGAGTPQIACGDGRAAGDGAVRAPRAGKVTGLCPQVTAGSARIAAS